MSLGERKFAPTINLLYTSGQLIFVHPKITRVNGVYGKPEDTWREGLKGMALQNALSRLRNNEEHLQASNQHKRRPENDKAEQVCFNWGFYTPFCNRDCSAHF